MKDFYKKVGKRFLERGFTLIELLVVIAIMSIMTSVVISELNIARMKARDSQRIAQVSQIARALDLYYDNHGSYPSSSALAVSDTPADWLAMITALRGDRLIGTLPSPFENQYSNLWSKFSLINTAHAMVAGPTYVPCSIQDYWYREADDYPVSYAYIAHSANQKYKIRVRLEYPSSELLTASYTGNFIGAATTGLTACDTSLNYYCISL